VISKRSIKEAASTMYGLTVASDTFQRTSNWKRIEKDFNGSNRSTCERVVECDKLEEIYSFKTMLRMLYQLGFIILKEFDDAVNIPKFIFSSSWVQFAGLSNWKENTESEEASLIDVAECLILFEEFIKSRIMLVASRLKLTSATSSPWRGDLVVPKASDLKCNAEKRVTPAPVYRGLLEILFKISHQN
jgi:hypothetical protein